MDTDAPSTPEELYNLAFRVAEDISRRNDHPLVLLIAVQMLSGSLVNAIDRLLERADSPATRGDITRMFRDALSFANSTGINGVHLAQCLFTPPQTDDGAAVSLSAARMLIGTENDAVEAMHRLGAAAQLIKSTYKLDASAERVRELVHSALNFLADEPELSINITAPGGQA